MLGPVDRARPSCIAGCVAAREEMPLLEIDVLEQALPVLLEQPRRLRPPAVDPGFLVSGKEISKRKMLSQEQIDVEVHPGPPDDSQGPANVGAEPAFVRNLYRRLSACCGEIAATSAHAWSQ